MDEETQPNNQPAETPAGGQSIDVNVNPSAQPSAQPAAQPAESMPPVESPAPAPPAPGTVVTGSDGSIGGPPQVVTSNNDGRGKRWLKVFLVIVLIAVLVAAGYFIYKQYVQKKPAPVVVQSKTIPLLKVGILNADYGNLYPDMSVSEYGYLVNAQMFEGLVRYENKSKIAPDLASTWSNPDDNTWLFTVKDGIKFHDGHTLAASDVKYSLDTVIASNSDLAQTFASTIDKVDLVGKNQVKITTKDPDPTLLNKLTFLYVIDANLPKSDNASQAGTGPYELKSGTTPTSTNVQMVAFNGYHGGQPKTKALDFGSADSVGALVKAFQNHQYNIVGPVPTTDAQKATGASQFISQEPSVFYMGFNTVAQGPLQNKQVREAVRYALNAQTIAKASGDSVTPISQLIPPEVPGYNPSITPYKQDVAKAKQLLTQAGYPNGFNITLSTSSDNQDGVNEIVKELKAAGITATVDNHSDFDEFINYFNGGKAQMYVVDYGSDTLDGLDIYNTTLSKSNYSNPKLDALLNQASTTVDPAKRLKLLQQAATIIDQDAPVVALSTSNDVWLMDKPYALHQDMPSAFISVYFYKAHLK